MADFRDTPPEKIVLNGFYDPKDFKVIKVSFPPKKSSPVGEKADGGTKPLTADRYLMPYFARISTTGC